MVSASTEAPDGIDVLVRRAQVEELFNKGAFPFVTNVINGAVLLAVVGREVEFARSVWWLGVLTLVTGARLLLWRVHRRQPQRWSVERWRGLFIAGLVASGLVWGSSAILLWTPNPGMLHALIGFVCGGMVAGVSFTAGSDVLGVTAFTIPALAPVVVRFAANRQPADAAMAIMIALFGVVMWGLASRTERWFKRTTALQASNTQLIAELSQARERLEQRVAERTLELERTVQQERAAQEQAREAVRARDEFMAVASHELRTPLGTLDLHVSAMERLLVREPELAVSPGELSERLKAVHRQVRRLTGLANTVLAASGLAHEGPTLERTQVELGPIIQGVVDDLTSYAPAGTTEILVEVHDPLPGQWDPVRVEQVVMNLVSNAMKYGAGNAITVSLRRNDDHAVLTVCDRGPGLPTADFERVFERFYRADVGARTGGLGLGLSVVRELVRAMGGSISVSSRPGQGATFIVDLPIVDARAASGAS